MMGGQPGPGGLPGRDREQASPRGSVLPFLNRYPRNRQSVTPSAHIACRDLPLSAIRFPDYLLTPTSLTWSQVTLPASQCRLMSTTNEAVVRVSAFTVNDHNKAARKSVIVVVMTSQAIPAGQISVALPCTHVIAWPPRRTDRRWQRNLSACTRDIAMSEIFTGGECTVAHIRCKPLNNMNIVFLAPKLLLPVNKADRPSECRVGHQNTQSERSLFSCTFWEI